MLPLNQPCQIPSRDPSAPESQRNAVAAHKTIFNSCPTSSSPPRLKIFAAATTKSTSAELHFDVAPSLNLASHPLDQGSSCTTDPFIQLRHTKRADQCSRAISSVGSSGRAPPLGALVRGLPTPALLPYCESPHSGKPVMPRTRVLLLTRRCEAGARTRSGLAAGRRP